MKRFRARLTYANVMSSIAVFLVLGGASAFAASQLGKNTVGTKQLKKNAVTAAKIKKNAITTAKIKNDAVNGTKVNEATLGTVPSANSANSANSAAVASSLTPLEATHIVGAPGQPGFEGGSENIPIPPGTPFGVNPVGFYKDHEGIVHLQGIAKVGTPGSLGVIFTLPAGFRPASGKLIIQEPLEEEEVIIVGSNVNVGMDLSGKIVGKEGGEALLDGITFKAES